MKRFKIMKPTVREAGEAPLEYLPDTIPFEWVEPMQGRAWINHRQTLESLTKRGGLDPLELVALLEDRSLRSLTPMTLGEAVTRLCLLLAKFPRDATPPDKWARAVSGVDEAGNRKLVKGLRRAWGL